MTKNSKEFFVKDKGYIFRMNLLYEKCHMDSNNLSTHLLNLFMKEAYFSPIMDAPKELK